MVVRIVPVVLFLIFAGSESTHGQPGRVTPSWQEVASGLEWTWFHAHEETPAGDSTLVVIRADPNQWTPRLFVASGEDRSRFLTARQWAERQNVPVVANAGMFATDGSTHVGYLRTADGHVNSPTVNHYQSAAAFARKREGLPSFRIFDLDEIPIDSVTARYQAVVQNLRLIKHSRENRWGPQTKRWSEVALAEDDAGRMLFVFSRSPYPMHTFNEILLDLPLGVMAAQHLEGGPEASLVLNTETLTPAAKDSLRVWMGSWETDFYEVNDNKELWPIPNVIGLTRR